MDIELNAYIQRVTQFREKTLNLDHESFVDSFELISKMDWLETLTIGESAEKEGFPKEDKIPFEFGCLVPFRSLTELSLSHARIVDLGSLSNFVNLKKLHLDSCRIENFENLSKLTLLDDLKFTKIAIQDVEPINEIRNLKRLEFNCCWNLTTLGTLSDLVHLEHVTARHCVNLVDLGILTSLTALQTLKILDCPKFEHIGPLGDLQSLKTLDLSRCRLLRDLSGLVNSKTLESIKMVETQVENLLPLVRVTSLRNVDCSKTKVSSLRPLASHIRKGMQIPWGGSGSKNSIFEYDECPIVDPPMEVVQKGRQAVIRYWRSEEDFAWFPRRVYDLAFFLCGLISLMGWLWLFSYGSLFHVAEKPLIEYLFTSSIDEIFQRFWDAPIVILTVPIFLLHPAGLFLGKPRLGAMFWSQDRWDQFSATRSPLSGFSTKISPIIAINILAFGFFSILTLYFLFQIATSHLELQNDTIIGVTEFQIGAMTNFCGALYYFRIRYFL